ncbi:hypothetical protein [Streptomyces sp. BK79]|uniref:hypothetical protein n=1 Tax=Streptomyces sp. BK79 TaxID=3350097 RepID=UPI00376F87E8
MSSADVIGAVGIAVLVVGVVALVVIVRSGPVVPGVPSHHRTCARCGHRSSEHGVSGGRCRVAVGGSNDRYDGGGNWIGWWNPTYCDCSGYRERGGAG